MHAFHSSPFHVIMEICIHPYKTFIVFSEPSKNWQSGWKKIEIGISSGDRMMTEMLVLKLFIHSSWKDNKWHVYTVYLHNASAGVHQYGYMHAYKIYLCGKTLHFRITRVYRTMIMRRLLHFRHRQQNVTFIYDWIEVNRELTCSKKSIARGSIDDWAATFGKYLAQWENIEWTILSFHVSYHTYVPSLLLPQKIHASTSSLSLSCCM